MWKFIFSGALLTCLLYFGNRPLKIGGSTLPPIAAFISPTDGFWSNGDTPYPQEIDLEGLQSTAEIYIDERGVPHIFTNKTADAMQVLGYMHAHDRLFQMDVTARFTVGRLSHLIGDQMLDIDQLMRRRGLPFAAENATRSLQKGDISKALLEAYTKGVNNYISQLKPSNYPIEYKLLHAKPEPWSILKTACIIKSMAFDLCFRNEDDIATKALQLLGSDDYAYLFPFRKKSDDPVIPKGTAWTPPNADSSSLGFLPNGGPTPLRAGQLYLPPVSNGSNNWAVDGSKTKSGAPILCNDPHLRLRLPSVWYECQLHTEDMNVYGVSLPGIPGVIIGFNESIAWGSTNVGMDVLDWVKIQWKDDNRQIYLVDGQEHHIEQRIEQIEIKNAPTVFDTVVYTIYGPLTYQSNPEHILYDHAMRWVGHDEVNVSELEAFMNIGASKRVDEGMLATEQFLCPAQNMAFASTSGDIGLRVTGALPLRDRHDGQFTIDDSVGAHYWKAYIPQSENPSYFNPERGFISSANQITTDATYPYPYYGYYADYRGRILNKKLAAMSNITVDDMKALQLNSESLLADEGLDMLVNMIGQATPIPTGIQERLHALQRWDRRFTASAIEPVLFIKWFHAYYNLLWDELPNDTKRPEYWRTIEISNDDPDNIYFDIKKTTKVEQAHDIALLSLEKAIAEVDSLLAKNSSYNWGKYNGNRISHLLNIDAFSSDLNEIDGFKYALNAINATHGPSWRMVVELSNPIKAWGVYPGGQSGRPGHRHYDDMLQKWKEGAYFPLHLYNDLEEIPEGTGQTIQCTIK